VNSSSRLNRLKPATGPEENEQVAASQTTTVSVNLLPQQNPASGHKRTAHKEEMYTLTNKDGRGALQGNK
jgi:hypothetical protein